METNRLFSDGQHRRRNKTPDAVCLLPAGGALSSGPGSSGRVRTHPRLHPPARVKPPRHARSPRRLPRPRLPPGPGHAHGSSPEQNESSSEFLEQLGPIGLPPDVDVQSLFDPTGQCCAHLQCASWSEGVSRGEAQCLLFVDKAIDSASTQVCAFCRQLGASLRCRETGCGRSYHFPCATAASTNQEWSQKVTWCTRHAHKHHYHGDCLDPPLVPSPLSRAGWQCAECRVCRACGLREAGSPVLVCERCDKVYHPHCLSPLLLDPPTSGWSCKSCRVCRRCGVRASGAWANHPSLCESCDPAQPCSLCGDAPDLYSPQDHVTCISCFRSVHTECIVQAGEARLGAEAYTCATCRPRAEKQPGPTTPHSPPAAAAITTATTTTATPAVFASSASVVEEETEEAPPISLPSEPPPSPESPKPHSPPRPHISSESPEIRISNSTQTQQSSPSSQPPTPKSERPPSPSENVLAEEKDRKARYHESPSPSQNPPSERVELSKICVETVESSELDPEERLTISETAEESSLRNGEESKTVHPQSPQLSPQPCRVSENSEPFQPEPMEVEQSVPDSDPPPATEHPQTPEKSEMEPTEKQQSPPSPSLEISEEKPKSPSSEEQVIHLELITVSQSPVQLSEDTDVASSPKSSPKDSHDHEQSSELDSTKLQESHTQDYLEVTDRQR
ncbi:hypothetical protein WMY93_029605 [Mugilogobius chulae]|uniref:[Histone H3]-lysine(4) N-trimethyltransferase n=1 Tax=Mugilogobius chulae TaxID=88201 RepID=A0AAW0MX60_9GOBI